MINNKKNIDQLNEDLSNRNVTYFITGEFKDENKKPFLTYHCTCCNNDFTRYRHWIYEKHKHCPVCINKEIVEGYNDVGTKHPEMIKYFVFDEEYKTHSSHSDYEALIKCPDCGLERRISIDKLIRRGFTCPCKDSYIQYYEGVNELKITNPEVYNALVNKQDGENVTKGNRKIVKFRCKDCGSIFERRISNACKIGLNCPVCSDGVSYPNKVGRYFIKQTDAKNIQFEYCEDWTQNKIYDIYFEYNNKKYVIEMDGNQHYRKNYSFHSQTYDEIHLNDLYKEKLAEENNVELIRIDCKISDIDYIKENITNSKLSEIFDLSNIDWKAIEYNSRNLHLLKSICDDYCKNILFIKEIAEKYYTSSEAIERYIKQGKQLELIPEDVDGNIRASRIRVKRNKREKKEL